MAEEFLIQLLKPENRINSDERQRCIMCLEECGSLNSETGVIECLIRLPCTHLVGSHCIATWLRDKNTCPECRRVFFPPELRFDLEHSTMPEDGGDEDDNTSDDDDNDDDNARYDDDIDIGIGDVDNSDDDDNDQDRLDRLTRDTESSSHHLNLNYAARLLSQLIAKRAFHMAALRLCSQRAKVAVAIYVASHLVRRPVTTTQLSAALATPPRTVLATYRLFHPQRASVIDGECLFLLREDPQRARTGELPRLAWPLLGDEEEWRSDTFWQGIAGRLGMEIEAATILDLVQVARALVARLEHSAVLGANSDMEIVALCIFVAACVRDVGVSCGEIAEATGVSEGDIRSVYALFYPHRRVLLENRAGDGSGTGGVDGLLREVERPVP